MTDEIWARGINLHSVFFFIPHIRLLTVLKKPDCLLYNYRISSSTEKNTFAAKTFRTNITLHWYRKNQKS